MNTCLKIIGCAIVLYIAYLQARGVSEVLGATREDWIVGGFISVPLIIGALGLSIYLDRRTRNVV